MTRGNRCRATRISPASPMAVVMLLGLTWANFSSGLKGASGPAGSSVAPSESAAPMPRTDTPPQTEQEADAKQAAADREAAHRYPEAMRKVREAWAREDNAQVRKLLNAQLPNSRLGVKDHRGFEWYYFDRKLNWSGVTLYGHWDGVRSIAFSPGGDLIASASVDATARVWSVATGRQVLLLKGHTDAVSGVAFSPDGQRIATASSDKTVKLWDAATGKELHTLEGHTKPVWCVAFAPDGKRLASGSFDHSVKMWDVAAAREIQTLSGHADRVTSIAFSPDGGRLASGGCDHTAIIWDAGGKRLQTLTRHGGVVWGVAFSPDGQKLSTTNARGDGTVTIWTAASGQPASTVTASAGALYSVAFTPDGERLGSADQHGSVKIWNPKTGNQLLSLEPRLAAVTSIAWSPAGDRLACASADGTVKMWNDTMADVSPLLARKRFDPSNFQSNIGAINNAEFTASGVVNVLEKATGRVISTLNGHVKPVIAAAFSPDGRRIATAGRDGAVKLWETATGQEVGSFEADTDEIRSLAFSSDGWELAAVGNGGLVKLWDARPAGSGRNASEFKDWRAELEHDSRFRLPVGQFRASSNVRKLAFSPDGRVLLIADPDRPVRIVDAPAQFGTPARFALQGETEHTGSLLFSVDGRRLVTNQVNFTSTVSLWDMDTGERMLTLPVQPKAVSSMAISLDGRKLATASLDRTLKLWDTKSGEQLQSLTPVSATITGMAFSPDGKWLATTGHDTTVKIWDIAAGKVTKSFATGRYFVSGIGFSPDGMDFASPALAGFKVWDTQSWRERYFPLSKSESVSQDGRLAFVPGGKRLVTVAIDGVHIWDSEAWREIVTRTTPFFTLGQALAFSTDGNYAATAEGNGDVRLWYLSPLVIPRPESGARAR